MCNPVCGHKDEFCLTLCSSVVVEVYSGSALQFWRVDRRQMGAYLCIASNDVPPAVSKRVILNVNCESRLTEILILFIDF